MTVDENDGAGAEPSPAEALAAECERLRREVAELRVWAGSGPRFVPPGHFYSPLPSPEDLREHEARYVFDPPPQLPGIALDATAQLELLRECLPFYEALPFQEGPTEGLRYRYGNPAYSYSDAILLACVLHHARPRRIVEVGSGWSSCVMLDVNERFFGNGMHCSFVEPFPELLNSLLHVGDSERVRVLPQRLQDVDLGVFRSLQAGDVLFVDSTHVAKVGSDVNRIFSEILPALAPGVFIHFHDIFYPFEYPLEWHQAGRAWNEAYVLRAFLQYNRSFVVVLFNTFLQHFHRDFFERHMPLCLKNLGGSIWLRKVEAVG